MLSYSLWLLAACLCHIGEYCSIVAQRRSCGPPRSFSLDPAAMAAGCKPEQQAHRASYRERRGRGRESRTRGPSPARAFRRVIPSSVDEVVARVPRARPRRGMRARLGPLPESLSGFFARRTTADPGASSLASSGHQRRCGVHGPEGQAARVVPRGEGASRHCRVGLFPRGPATVGPMRVGREETLKPQTKACRRRTPLFFAAVLVSRLAGRLARER